MTGARNSVLIAVESRRAGFWEIYQGDKRPNISEGPTIIRNRQALSGFADSLAARLGGPGVRAVVFVSDRITADQAEAQPAILARYPRLICSMSRGQALAHTAEAAWSRFLTIERSSGVNCSLFCRTREGLVEQRPTAFEVVDVIGIARAFGIKHCLLSEAEDEQSSHIDDGLASELETHIASPNAAIAGACTYASTLLATQGVSVENKLRTSLRASRLIEYSVFHPSRAVFDLEDTTLAEVAGSRPILIVADLNLEGA